MTTMPPPMCWVCTHRTGKNPPTCTAFPERIPDAIYIESADHRQPFPGDHGIRFDSDGSDRALRLLATYDWGHDE